MKKKKEKIVPTRSLTQEERLFSKTIHGRKNRKEFYKRLMRGENFKTQVLPWILPQMSQHEQEVDHFEELLENITICSKEKQPPLDLLKKALQVSCLCDMGTIEQQLNMIVPLFYINKEPAYEKEFKKISYAFLDELAEKTGVFTGQMLDYIFAGDYFSLASGVLLAKHSEVLNEKNSVCKMHLNTMLLRLAQHEQIMAESVEEIALKLFETSLKNPLNKEEIVIMIIYTLMQLYSWNMVDTHKKINLSSNTHWVEEAIEYCEQNGFQNLEMWERALTLRDDFHVWDRQVKLITHFLLRHKLHEHSQLKAITYRFILQSFRYGFVSSEMIDFIFDGRFFSNASTVVLALSCNQLTEHNLAPYICQKLSDMMAILMQEEKIDVPQEQIASYLLNTALERQLYKEEVSILNIYVLMKVFN